MDSRKINLLSVFLKEKRTCAGLSQWDVAKKLGYSSPQFVSNWERGLSDPPIMTLAEKIQLSSNAYTPAAVESLISDFKRDVLSSLFSWKPDL